MGEPQEYLADGSPLIMAAQLGKLRLVRLLVEGGAQVNERNQQGETPLLAACKALRGEQQSGSTALRLLRYLLQNQADPNTPDKAGRTALMYACMERAGAEVAATLMEAGADPTMEDYAGASALVYAINAHHQATLQVLLDACRAKGRDIIIIATDLSSDGGSVTRRYLNVPPSPDTSPVSCMSPSDIELKTGSPNSPMENIFNFRGPGRRGCRAPTSLNVEVEPPQRHRLRSEPWLAIHNLAHLSHAYEEGLRQGGVREEEEGKEEEAKRCRDDGSRPRSSGPVCGDSDSCGAKAADGKPSSGRAVRKGCLEKPPLCLEPLRQGRRNTLPSLTIQPSLLQLPSLSLDHHGSDSLLQLPSLSLDHHGSDSLLQLPSLSLDHHGSDSLLQLPSLSLDHHGSNSLLQLSSLSLDHHGSDSLLQLPSLSLDHHGSNSLLQLPSLSLDHHSSDSRLHGLPSTAAAPDPACRGRLPPTRCSSSLSLAPPGCTRVFDTTLTKKRPQETSLRLQLRGGFLPPLPVSSASNARVSRLSMEPSPTPHLAETQAQKQEGQWGRRQQRRHSIQLEQMAQVGSTDEILFVL